MLKRQVGNQLWFVSQPDHAAVSGYLAAHWGNNRFTRPGYYAPSPNSAALRSETVLAIAEHDNGWWEWEADPEIDPRDGLPLHLTDLTLERSLERWLNGIPRFAQSHPYIGLLISFHAYWLYATRAQSDLDPAFLHPLFGNPADLPGAAGPGIEQIQEFVRGQRETQDELIARLAKDPAWTSAVQPESLYPHVRLLQLTDALSLALGLGVDKPLRLTDIPRSGWGDRVTLEVAPLGQGRIVCHPYPFDADPLPVAVRARVLDLPVEVPPHFHAWWHSLPRQQLRFEYCSR